MTFGYKNFKVIGDSYTRFYREVLNRKLPCMDIKELKGVLYFRVSVEFSREITDLCDELGLVYEITKRKGLFTKVKKLLAHKGIIIGAASVAAVCIVLSNFVFKFNILCDDADIQKAILAVLKENGVEAGSYIPNLNLVVLERELKQKVDDISWAGISVSGSTLTIDVVKNVEEPESRKVRMPCNLIAKYDAVIDKIEVFDGQLMTTIGSAVVKGDILVSGTVVNETITYENGKEIKDIDIKYVRSLAKIYGTFEQKVIIEQTFEDKQEVISEETIKKRYLRIFDMEIPLFFTAPKGNYISESEYSGLSIGENEIPIGINTVSLNKYSFEENIYSESEALQLAKEQLSKYEENFFDDYEIKNVETTEEITEEGVLLTAVYTLYGEISKESEFFIAK